MSVKYFRAPTAFAGEGTEKPTIDRENRVIRGYAVATRGRALGHGMWLDESFLESIVATGNTAPYGIKSRFTHPGICADGLAEFLGRTKNLRLDGNLVRGDLHFSKAADADKVEHILTRAEEDPTSFGASIVFLNDETGEDEFKKKHCDAEGNFVSPDAENEANLPHCRLAQLRASDIVDEPAANAGGFLSDNQELVARAHSLLSYITGLTDESPDEFATGGIPAERFREFIASFFETNAGAAEAFFDRYLGNGMPPKKMPEHEPEHAPEDHEPERHEEGDMVMCPECGHEFVPGEDEMAATDSTATFAVLGLEATIWRGCASAAARVPFEASDEAATFAGIAGHYDVLGIVTPWERNLTGWEIYKRLCAELKRKSDVVNDVDLSSALRLCGFDAEADVLTMAEGPVPTEPPVVEQPAVEVVVQAPELTVTEDVQTGLSENDLVMIREIGERVIDQKMLATKGCLPD